MRPLLWPSHSACSFANIQRSASVYDEEDAAVSAVNSLFRGIRRQRFHDLRARHNLWRILIVSTNRKLRARWRRQAARDARGEKGCDELSLNEAFSQKPAPAFVAEMMEDTEQLFDSLQDDMRRRIAVMRTDLITKISRSKSNRPSKT